MTIVAMPAAATNLNIGMEYWGAAPSSAFPATPVQGRTGSRDGVQSQHWIQVSFLPFIQTSPNECTIRVFRTLYALFLRVIFCFMHHLSSYTDNSRITVLHIRNYEKYM